MTANKYHEFNEQDLAVLAFLKNIRQYAPENFDYLIFYGTSAKEMIKFLENPEKYGNFDFVFVCELFTAIRKTFNQYLTEQTEIEPQTTDDIVLNAILINANNPFRSIFAHERLINKSHCTAYLMRDDVINHWNGWLLITVQRIVEKMKAEIRLKSEIAI